MFICGTTEMAKTQVTDSLASLPLMQVIHQSNEVDNRKLNINMIWPIQRSFSHKGKKNVFVVLLKLIPPPQRYHSLGSRMLN